MIASTMLARVRSYINEATEDFWKDTDIYKWLTDGQFAVIDSLTDDALYEYREKEQKGGSLGICQFPSEEKIYRLVTVSIGESEATAEPCILISPNEQKRLADDPYLPGTSEYPIGWFKDGKLYYRPTTSTTVIFEYVPVPDDIDSSTNSALPKLTHLPICHYATARAWEFQNTRLDLAQKYDALFQQFIDKTNQQFFGRTNTRQPNG